MCEGHGLAVGSFSAAVPNLGFQAVAVVVPINPASPGASGSWRATADLTNPSLESVRFLDQSTSVAPCHRRGSSRCAAALGAFRRTAQWGRGEQTQPRPMQSRIASVATVSECAGGSANFAPGRDGSINLKREAPELFSIGGWKCPLSTQLSRSISAKHMQ